MPGLEGRRPEPLILRGSLKLAPQDDGSQCSSCLTLRRVPTSAGFHRMFSNAARLIRDVIAAAVFVSCSDSLSPIVSAARAGALG
jgi:hypothetical protein